MLHLQEIVDLADHLRGEGYQPTLHQVLAAQTVVRQTSLQDSGLGSLVRLATILRPIFSATPDEQERFEKVYLDWLRARSHRPRTISDSFSSTPPPEPPRIHWRMKLAMPCLLIVPTLTAWFLWQDLRAREAVGRVVADDQPVAHATVKLGDRTATTSEDGIFEVSFKNDDMPLQLLVESKGYLPSQSVVGQTIIENRKWLYLSIVEWDVQYQLGDVQLAKEPTSTAAPVQKPTPPKFSLEKLRTIPPPVRSWWQRISYLTALMALAPSVLVLLWLLYQFGRRAVLKRQSSRIQPELKHIHVQAGTTHLFPSLSLRHVTQRLRQTRFEESTELDVARTIHVTMNRGGLFTPIFGSKHEPSYVALIDRATVADHQANVAAQVVRDLAKGYVLVRQYEFDEQPTILRKADPLRTKPQRNEGATAVATRLEIMSLGEVTAKFPTSRMLCFAEPRNCFDPLTGRLNRWVETLEAWEERFLFTPGTRGQWGQAEQILSRRGFHVIPLTLLGLQLFPHLLEQESPQGEAIEAATGKRRGIYERTPQRWLERHPPSPEIIAKLMADLRQELESEGMLWMTACAAYPEIHWAMTLEWGVRLFGHGSTAEALLPKLTPLVWFRHAFMPDWFRSALYDQLSAQEAEQISQELGDIISALNPESGDSLQLKIATPAGARQHPASPVGGFRGWLQKFRRRSFMQAMGRAAEPGNPMRDYVMLQYLSGKQGKALTPYAPKALLTLLFPKGQPWLGFRPLFLFLAAALITTGLWWWRNPAPIGIPSPIVDVGFLEESNEVIVQREDDLIERWGQKGQELVLLESGNEDVFADRLSKVKMGLLTVPDPKGYVELTYQKAGQLHVTRRGDGHELARESAPAAQVASLRWPAGFDGFLVVATKGIPDLVRLRGLESFLNPQEIMRTGDDGGNPTSGVKASTGITAKKSDERTKEKEAKLAEAKRQAELVAKKVAESAQSTGSEQRSQDLEEPRLERKTDSPKGAQQSEGGGQESNRSALRASGETPANKSRNVLEGMLRVSQFYEPIYYLTAPISWVPDPAQQRYKAVTVPAGFVTEFGSIPRVYGSILRPDGEYAYAAIIHDYLYWTQTRSREEADNIFKMTMEDLGVDAVKVKIIYGAIRVGGKAAWDENAKKKMLGEQRILAQFPDDPRTKWEDWKRRPGVFASIPGGSNPTEDRPQIVPNKVPQETAETKPEEKPASLKDSEQQRSDVIQQQAMKENIQLEQAQSVEKPPSKITGKDGSAMATDGDNTSSQQATGTFPPFQPQLEQSYYHPVYPELRILVDRRMIIVSGLPPPYNGLPWPTQLSSIPENEWILLGIPDRLQLPISVMRRGQVLMVQWLSSEPTQQQATKRDGQLQQAKLVEGLPSRTRITGKDGAPMVLVPAGKFTMGTGEDDTSAPNDERPTHLVLLDGFYIDQYEVTTAQYGKFIEEERQSEPAAWSADVVRRHAKKPVVGVSWKDATAYCTWVGKRLPTEAEWEKAARGTDQRLYPWGNVAPGSLANFSQCCDFNNYEVLSDVGYLDGGKSPYGAYDMAGNAWEWVADWYDANYYSKSPAHNPKGPSSGEYRVLRGGAWTLQSASLRTTSRFKATPQSRNNTDVGFRCAQDASK